MAKRLCVVDYGAGNLASVERGLRAAGCEVDLVVDPEIVLRADGVLLPGVGAYGTGMEMLRARGLDEALLAFARTGKPLLGVCLGMQFLMSRSFEFGEHRGLNLISGDVVELPRRDGWPVPNIGWCAMQFTRDQTGTPFAVARTGTDFYFAHSYYCEPQVNDDVLATIDYGGASLAAVVSRDNVHGCQFHPEISDAAGHDVLRTLQQII